MCTVARICALCAAKYIKRKSCIKFSLTFYLKCVWSGALCVFSVVLWFSVTDIKVSVFTVELLLPWFFLYSVSLFISMEKGTEKSEGILKNKCGKPIRESVMSTDFYGDTSVDIKACFTPCIRIISTLKAKGIIPQGVCFILSKSVNIILTNAQNHLAR